MVVRKNYKNMTQPEWNRFVAAIKRMNTLQSGETRTQYMQFVDLHFQLASSTVSRFVLHRNIGFLAWHRVMLFEIEILIQSADKILQGTATSDLAIPYWNWTVDNSTKAKNESGKLWRNSYLGGDGDSGDDDKVKDSGSPFRAGVWIIEEDRGGGRITNYLRRNLSDEVPTGMGLATPDDLNRLYDMTRFDTGLFDDDSPDTSFRNVLEGWSGGKFHNAAHVWVGGSMQPFTSPNDPVFYLNHCNVDRIWAIWQRRQLTRSMQSGVNPLDFAQYMTDAQIDTARAGGNPRALKLNDSIPPWNGTGGRRNWTTRMVLNYQRIATVNGIAGAQDYRYDTEPAGNFTI